MYKVHKTQNDILEDPGVNIESYPLVQHISIVKKPFYTEFKIEEIDRALVTNDIYTFDTPPSNLQLCNSQKNYDIKEGIIFRSIGDESSWQHFCQDTLCMFTPEVVKFLQDNTHVNIILPSVSNHHTYFIHDVFKLNNDIVTVSGNLNVCKLYFPRYYPVNRFHHGRVPFNQRQFIREKISERMTSEEKKNLTYMTRRDRPTRYVINEDEVVEFLKDYTLKNNLNFVLFSESDYETMDEKFNILYNSSIVVLPSGGASYHAYACQPGTKIIEAVGGKCHIMTNTSDVFIGLELDYNIQYFDGGFTSGFIWDVDILKDFLCVNNLIFKNI